MSVKSTFTIFLAFLSFSIGAQQSNQVSRRIAMKRGLKTIFNSQGSHGLYLGIKNGVKMGNYSLGADLKLYDLYFVPVSAQIHYDHIFVNNQELPKHCIGMSAYATFLALEVNYYFGNDSNHFRISPKIGLDMGNFGIFYGYGINTTRRNYGGKYGHQFTLKYSLYLQPFESAKRQYPKWKDA